MRSKLEPGCRAIIVGSREPENSGKTVKCIRYVDKIKGLWNPDLWEVDSEIKADDGRYFNLCPGYMLQRIDDHPDKETLLESANIITQL